MSRSRNRLAIVRQGHEIAKPPSLIVDWNVAPEAGPKYYGDHLAPALLGSSERALHFLLGAVIGVDEVGADQENYQLGRGEFGLDCPVEMLTRAEHVVVPDNNQAFAFQRTKVYQEPVLQLLIGVRV